MRLLVKIGGAQLEQAGPRARLCTAIANARAAGHEIVVVHGGGNQIRDLGKALGIADRYHDGLRITGSADLRPAILHAYADHRMVHFAALLALRIRGVEIDDIACTSKTMPRFPQDWAGLIG